MPQVVPLPTLAVFTTVGFAVAGVALVAIPVVIHILNRQRFRIVDWAAMEFLLRAMRRNRRRLRMEQWVLLAVRCLAIAMIGIALARPSAGCVGSSLAAGLGGAGGLHVFVIDNSFSTQYEGKGYTPVPGAAGVDQPAARNHLEQQKQMARRLIDTLQNKVDAVAIVTAADPAIAVIATPGTDLDVARRTIDNIQPAYTRTALAKALEQARAIAQDKGNAQYTVRNLYVFTDGTRSAWEGEDRVALRAVAPELTKLYRVSHFDVSDGKPQWNRAVEAVAPETNLVTTRMYADMAATVHGYGTPPAPGATVGWAIDNEPFGQPRPVSPDPTTPPLSVRVQPKDLKFGGARVLSAAVKGDGGGADPLPGDDRRYRVVEAATEVKVLIVEGETRRLNGRTSMDSPGFFLEVALAPKPPGLSTEKSSTYVAADTVGLGEFDAKRDRGQLDPYRAIFLADVPALNDGQCQALARFVYNGGALLMFMGDRVQPDQYNDKLGNPRLFADLPGAGTLLPGRLIGLNDRRTAPTGYSFDFNPQAELVPAMLKEFQRYANTGLDAARINAYMRLDVSEREQKDDAAAAAAADPAKAAPRWSRVTRVLNYRPPAGEPAPAGGPDPAITSHAFGAGTVVFVTTAANPINADAAPGAAAAPADGQQAAPRGPWHNLVVRAAWPQLLHEMLGASVTTGDAWMNVECGQPLRVPSRVDQGGVMVTNPTLVDEQGAAYPLAATADDVRTATGVKFVSTTPLAKPGLYKLTLAEGRTVPVAVNPSAQEADVRTVGSQTIRQVLTGGRDVTVNTYGSALPAEVLASGSASDDWAPALLTILLGLLAVECLMAMFFGHNRKGAGDAVTAM
ncbi:MAG TPA: BatA domain-containing protein, partial [Humisphaera sp.]